MTTVIHAISTTWIDNYYQRWLTEFEIFELCCPGFIQQAAQELIALYQPELKANDLMDYTEAYGERFLFEAAQAQSGGCGLDMEDLVSRLIFNGQFYLFMWQFVEEIIQVMQRHLPHNVVSVHVIARPHLKWTDRIYLNVRTLSC